MPGGRGGAGLPAPVGVGRSDRRPGRTGAGTEPHRFTALPAPAPAQLAASLAPPRRPRPGTPPAARLLRVVRPGWSGIMMATIAVRLLNVQIATPLLVGLALAGAFVLGGAALTGDRKRQLDKRRGDAIAALRSTVEEFRLSLAKHL